MRRVAVLALVWAGGAGASAAVAGEPTAQIFALREAAFVAKPQRPSDDAISLLLDRNSDVPRLGDLPFTPRAASDPRAESVTVIRWPNAFSFDQGPVSVDLSPHAGLRRGGAGDSAEAGATIELSKADAAGERLKDIGVQDGAAFGDRGRWYLFAAASGRAVGLNMLHGEGGWDRAGWSTDTTSKLVGDTQVGVGWRRGAMQTSVGYVHRSVKSTHVMRGIDPHDDDMVAFSLSVKPRK